MNEIHAEVDRKRRAGLYPPDVMAELEVAGPTDGQDDPLSTALLALHHNAGFTHEVPTGSRKRGLAPVASTFKRVVRGSVQWYIIGVLQQVQLFAVHVIRAITLLADRVWKLEHTVAELESADASTDVGDRLAALESAVSSRAGMNDVITRIEALERELHDTHAERLPNLERAVRGLRERVDHEPAAAAPAVSQAQRSDRADRALDYFGFESHFRGTEEDIRAKQRVYVDLFRGAPGPVVDLGCGRGEFLELLRDSAVGSYGIDRHPDMVDRCREKGLRAEQGDALEHLRGVRPRSLGGIFSAQMIEHLEIPDVPRFFELAADALAPGGHLVIETINPESLFVFASAFYVDLGHLRPLHPLTLRFLAEEVGFSDVHVEYFSSPPADVRLEHVEAPDSMRPVVETINENFRRLDAIVFGPQDYALIARR
jgi:O-antigen chain-terminating methyltransferase